MQRTKRSACDRCRDRKLRCHREEGVATCIRCTRSNASCVTGSSKPLGRRHRAPLYPSSSISHSYTHPSQCNTGSSDMSSILLDMPLDLSCDLHPEPWDPVIASIQADDFDVGMGHMALEEVETPGELVLASNSVLPQTSHQPTINPMDTYAAITLRSSLERAPAENHECSFADSNASLSLLSRINSDLYEWISLLEERDCLPPWRLAAGDVLTNSNNPVQLSYAQSDKSKARANPVGNFLQMTTQLINALKMLTVPESLNNGLSTQQCIFDNLPTFTEERTSAKPLNNIAAVLTTMTGHLLLIRLYRALFARIRYTLETMPEELDRIIYEPPIRICGVSLPQGNIHMKVILEVFEHQLIQVEKLLGLPEVYRVQQVPPPSSDFSEAGRPKKSQRSKTSETILDYDKYQSLLEAIIGETLGNKEDKSGHTQSDSLKDQVEQLRRDIAKVKDLLRG